MMLLPYKICYSVSNLIYFFFFMLDCCFRNNMGGSNEWDNRMMDSLKNFDLSSPEVKQQFGKFMLDFKTASFSFNIKVFWL